MRKYHYGFVLLSLAIAGFSCQADDTKIISGVVDDIRITPRKVHRPLHYAGEIGLLGSPLGQGGLLVVTVLYPKMEGYISIRQVKGKSAKKIHIDEKTELVFPTQKKDISLDNIKGKPYSVQYKAVWNTDTLVAENVSPFAASIQVVAPPTVSRVDETQLIEIPVFYGTDRKPLSDRPEGWLRFLADYWPSVLAVLLVLLVYPWCLLYLQSRILWVRIVSVGVVVVVLVVNMAIVFQQKPTKSNFGSELGELQFGISVVTLPPGHEPGHLERPLLPLPENPDIHVAIKDVQPLSEPAFLKQLSDAVGKSHPKDILVFIHGFNVPFEDALRRTAQLKYDLSFEAVAVCYSWPSEGKLLLYTHDENKALETTGHLKVFLDKLVEKSGAGRIHLIAHSMGNRPLLGALQDMSRGLGNKPPVFTNVILTAPDEDRGHYQNDLHADIVKVGTRVTLYASGKDQALLLSKLVHGDDRLGDSGEVRIPLLLNKIDSVEVSAVDTSLVGHSYFGDNNSVITDMKSMIIDGLSPAHRTHLTPRTGPGNMPYREFEAQGR